MKNASQIIDILQHRPQFSKLNRVKCSKKIQTLLPLAIEKMIKFSYFKDTTLFFVFNHPAGKQEFDNKIEGIKEALNFLPPKECSGIMIKDIKAFVTNTPEKKQKHTTSYTSQTYPERAKGEFEIPIQDPKLHELVKSIRDIIRAK